MLHKKNWHATYDQNKVAMQNGAPSRSLCNCLSLTLSGILFGRLKYTLEELQPYVRRGFEILRRWYFNRTRRHYREALDEVSDIAHLRRIELAWRMDGYSARALRLVHRRIAEVSAPGSSTSNSLSLV